MGVCPPIESKTEIPGVLEIKLVIVGPNEAGKTSMLITEKDNTFNDRCAPTTLDEYEYQKDDSGHQIKVQIIDTSGDPNLAQNRKIYYQDANVVMICISTADEAQLPFLSNFWREARSDCKKGTPLVLVGTKTDLRDENPEGAITSE